MTIELEGIFGPMYSITSSKEIGTKYTVTMKQANIKIVKKLLLSFNWEIENEQLQKTKSVIKRISCIVTCTGAAIKESPI